ncbi:MAG: glycosyltransferase family 4 protein [Planctomycetaceae bacterium]
MTVTPRVFFDGEIYSLQSRGGISNYFSQLVPRLADRGVGVTVLTDQVIRGTIPSSSGVVQRRWFPLGSRVWSRLPQSWQVPAEEMGVRHWCRKIDRTDAAVLHTSYFTSPPLRRAPLVVTVYDMIYELFPELFNRDADERFRQQKRRCVEAATRIIAISNSAKRDVCELCDIDPDRVDVTPLGVDVAYWRSRAMGIHQEVTTKLQRPYLLYVGTRFSYKNFRRFVEAYDRSPLSADFDIVAAGCPWSPEEQEFLGHLGAAARVRNVVSPTDEELAMLYEGATAFIYPSLYEGFGLPLLEAMACGTPVVASNAGSIVEVAADAADYFDPNDSDSMTAAISRAVEPARSQELRSRGEKRVGQFDWDRTADLTLQCYSRALGS